MIKTWFLVAFVLSSTNEWVLAPEEEGWKQEPQNGGYEECILRRDHLNYLLNSQQETKGKYKLECKDERVL